MCFFMSRKQFTAEQKLKYIKILIEKDLEMAMITFVEDFWEERYKENYLKYKNKRNPFKYAKMLITDWYNLYNLDMELLKSKTGIAPKKGKSGRKRKISINDLNEYERQFYQDVLEEILEEHGITNSDIIEKVKKRKDEKNIKNCRMKILAEIFDINRTSIYSNYLKKQKKDSKEKYIKQEIIDWILAEAEKLGLVIGRDKLYYKYIRSTKKYVSSYVFRINYEKSQYKSLSYVRSNKSRPPKEAKYDKIWTYDFLKGDFSSSFFAQTIHADIKYVRVKEQWYYLHVLTETFSNSILNWTLSKERTADSTIKLLDETIKKFKIKPQIFHSDHGIEYANNKFRDFLKTNNIKQSMSPKGNSLANRPSEYLFSIFQRELFDFYDTSKMNLLNVYNIVNKFVVWYNLDRPQSNMEYKTPYAVNQHIAFCV
ncbi:transposase [Mycoplasma struthionis]|uniref:Transposase n=3 Tax=Mycoplasma struthionis TaxID=538220 RepID=A0A3G8LGE9_9MOLU|nr:transposase [Mycoplasma struthionis]